MPWVWMAVIEFQTRTGSTGHLDSETRDARRERRESFNPERAPQAIWPFHFYHEGKDPNVFQSRTGSFGHFAAKTINYMLLYALQWHL